MTERRQTAVLLGAAFLIYAPFVFLGFGANFDSMRIGETGRMFMTTGVYTPSRYPGFPVHEIPAAVLADLGGATLSNAGTMAMAMAGAYAFLRLLAHFAVPNRALLTVALIANPMYWTAATYTIDYVWSLAWLLVGFALVRHRYPLIGALALGMATGSRATSFGFAILVIGYQFVTERRDGTRALLSAAIVVAIGLAAYAPTMYSDGWLRLYFGEWSRLDYLATFGYGNLLFLGPPAVLGLPLLIAAVRRPVTTFEPRWRPLAWLCVAVIAGYEALFLMAPIQVGYLLPALPCLLLLLGMTFHDRPRLLLLWVLLSASSGIVEVNVLNVTGGLHRVQSSLPPLVSWAAVRARGRATVMSGGLFVRWGYVVVEANARWHAISASTRRE